MRIHKSILLSLVFCLFITSLFLPTTAHANIAVGYDHTVALKGDGSLWAWGSNTSAQLGDGTTTNRISPVQIGTATDWAQVAAGAMHTTALKENGSLWAWGGNAYGQLGDGTTSGKLRPVQIGTATDWAQVAAGALHTIALKENGSLWSWGWNDYGQLGDGTTSSKLSPVQIGTATNWAQVKSGYYHTLALKEDGSLWVWGMNANGQLGDGTTSDKLSPVQIGTATDWAQVTAGNQHTLALKEDGSLWAWGANYRGQLGNGTTTDSLIPLRIGTATDWSQVAAALYHSIALKGDSSLWSWGWNVYGQLGDGTTTDSLSPMQIGTASDWEQVVAGRYNTLALNSDDLLWAWGRNNFGQLGDGTTTDRLVPTPINFTVSSSPFWIPLYRSYSTNDTDHFYTTNPVERDNAANNLGYTYEKVETYISNRAFVGGVPLHRLYNGVAKSHFYTTSDQHRDDALVDPNWTSEGEAGYVYPNPTENMVPVYHLYSSNADDHFYTASEFERDYAVATYNYQDEGVAFYAAQNSSGTALAGKPVAKVGGVDLESGGFIPYNNHVDFSNPSGFGMPFVFARTYNSKNVESGALGQGWNHSYDIRLIDLGVLGVFVKWGNGRIDYYGFDGINYDPTPGVYNQLINNSGTFKLTTKNKTVYTFLVTEDGGNIHRPIEIKDRNGIKLTLMYDAVKKGALDHVVDGSNRTYRFHYIIIDSPLSGSNEYRLSQVVEEDAGTLNRNFSFGYDADGRLTSYTNAKGHTTTYVYDAPDYPNLLSKIILPEGNTITSSYDGDERVETIEVSRGTTVSSTTQVTYNELIDDTTEPIYGTVYQASDLGGNTSTLSVSHNQSMLGIVKDGLGQIARVEQYDANLNPTHIIDKNGHSWFYAYNSSTGNLTSIVNPENEVTTYTYDITEPNNLLQITDPENNITRFDYDDVGNVEKMIRVINGSDIETLIGRYPNGLVQTVTYPQNNSVNATQSVNYSYDAYGYLSNVTDPLGNVASFTYDAGGRLLNSEDPDQVDLDYSYDALNHVETVTDTLNRVTTYTYDRNGNLDTLKDPRNIITDFDYNDSDLVDSVTEANVRVAQYDYDEAGRTKTITNAKDNTWQMDFDDAGNLSSKTTPLNLTDNFYEYYPDGSLKRQVDRNGRETSYLYDGAGRLAQMTITGGNQYTYQYYDNSTLERISRNGALVGLFNYDERGKLTSYTDPNNNNVGYTYYPGGNLETITYPGSKVVTYDYDARNLLSSVTDWLGRRTSYAYTDGGRLERMKYPNGTYIEYGYDAYFRLVTVSNKQSDGSIIYQHTVDVFDELDAPTQVTTTGGIPAPAPVRNETYSYDDNNRIESAGAATYTHNDIGERLSQTLGGVTDTFTWDANDVPGRLTNMTVNSTSRSYGYDGLGNRISSAVGGVTTRYVMDVSGRLANVIAETDEAGNVTAYYLHGLGLIARIETDTAESAHYYHYDRRGNTVALTDDSGNVTDQYSYDPDPFGYAIAKQGSTTNPFTFVGRFGVMDEGDDLFYMRARFYDASTGRFLSEDPIGFAGGDLNLYGYVAGNPIVGIDPSGLVVNTNFDGNEYHNAVEQKLNILRNDDITSSLMNYLDNSEYQVNITNSCPPNKECSGPAAYNLESGNVNIHFSINDQDQYGEDNIPGYIALAHELGHASDFITSAKYGLTSSLDSMGLENSTVSKYENPLREKAGMSLRKSYSGQFPIWNQLDNSKSERIWGYWLNFQALFNFGYY